MDGLIFLLFLIAALGGVCVLFVFSRVQPLDLSGSALHPYNMLGFFCALFVLDFVALYATVADRGQGIFGHIVISQEQDVTSGFVFFVLCLFSLISGIAFVVFRSPQKKKNKIASPNEAEKVASRIVLIFAVFAGSFAALRIVWASLGHFNLLYVAGMRTVFFRDEPLLLIAVTMLVPAYILFGSRIGRFRTVILVALPVMLLLFPVGGRSAILYPLIAIAYWLSQSRRISLLWLYAAAPVVGYVALIYQFLARENASSFSKYLELNGGVFGALFSSPNISMAEGITANLASPIIQRAPLDSVLGALMLPLPRSFFPWKPFGASTDFSMSMDVGRWALVKSEWTITGFVNLLYDFGYVGALLACGALGYLWATILVRSSRRPNGTAFVGPISIIVCYVFLRGDIYITSQFLWPVLAILVLYTVVLKVRTPKRGVHNPLMRPSIITEVASLNGGQRNAVVSGGRTTGVMRGRGRGLA